jgi:hypothetical protein
MTLTGTGPGPEVDLDQNLTRLGRLTLTGI